MPKIYHPKRGFVITTDQVLIDEILAEGGQVVLKNREIDQPIDDLIADPAPGIPEEWDELSTPPFNPVKDPLKMESPKPKQTPKFKSKLAK